MPRLTRSSQASLEPAAGPLLGRPAAGSSRVNCTHQHTQVTLNIPGNRDSQKRRVPPWEDPKKYPTPLSNTAVRHRAPPGGPPWKSALEGLQIRRPTGLRSVARNNKATRLLTRPGPTAKSSAKDLSLARCKIAIRWLSDLRFRGSPAASLLRSGAGAYPHPPSARRGESPVPAWILT